MKPLAWLVEWDEDGRPVQMITEHDPGPPRDDEKITPLVAQAAASPEPDPVASAPPADYDWMPEARQMAAQCWCDPETSSTQMDVVLAEAVARRIAAWMQTGAFHARNEEYWRDRAHVAESAAKRIVLLEGLLQEAISTKPCEFDDLEERIRAALGEE
jgi:hypothetical protein